MKSSDIRQAFFDYFTQKGHKAVESSALIPGNDPTLLFTNAGMVQFKDTFLGLETRTYSRAVSAQRCVRAGGKHNDLENVGYTARHHTFFEMLGNFSFGDYFKRDAIFFAWEFLTQVLKLPIEKLWVTVYEQDDEAADIWLNELRVSPARFSRCGEKDNFWSMGETGPCGPCTEIFYDHGSDIAGGPPGSSDEDGDRYIEIWNLVFMQYNRDKTGQLHLLPKPSVDTGMGLERITAVVQGVHNNYDIDSFQYLIKAILTNAPTINPDNASLKVIADHIRACAFLIADGVMPSNEGRGYVLRRIIRRAVRHGNTLCLPSPFFHNLVQPLCNVLGTAYPSLIVSKAQISQILLQEEQQFTKTLEQGLRLLHDHIQTMKTKEITGDMAFKLYDTYGFPIDLTEDIAREKGLTVDIAQFNTCMQQQRMLSQLASQFVTDYSTAVLVDDCSTFHGYEKTQLTSTIVAILQEGKKTTQLIAKQSAGIILSDTPFYAESGGQVGDTGLLLTDHTRFLVEDTQKLGNAIVHYGRLTEGQLAINQSIKASVDVKRRDAIRINHTATHLLHAALKTIIGSHVQQKGSLVDAERARFDFSHPNALTAIEIEQVEQLVNTQIRANHPVSIQKMSIDEAKQAGAIALFEEKYSDVVRVLTMGEFSKELCGGTHATYTGELGLCKIITEYGIASGVRRIELMTGAAALNWVGQQLGMLDEVAKKLKTTVIHVNDKLLQYLQQTKQQEKELQQLQIKLATLSGQDLQADVQNIAGICLLVKNVEHSNMSALRTLLDQLKANLPVAVLVLYTIDQDKMNVVASVSKSLIAQGIATAPTIVHYLCGKGGGRDDMAQGGGMVPNDLAIKLTNLATWAHIK